ncbi:DNA polymerase III subunit epsilon, partial [Rhizobium ruizarguesonis]
FEQLVAWSKEPGLLPRVHSGAERGKSWDRLDIPTLQVFARDRDIDVRFSAGTELRRRGAIETIVAEEAAQGTLL